MSKIKKRILMKIVIPKADKERIEIIVNRTLDSWRHSVVYCLVSPKQFSPTSSGFDHLAYFVAKNSKVAKEMLKNIPRAE